MCIMSDMLIIIPNLCFSHEKPSRSKFCTSSSTETDDDFDDGQEVDQMQWCVVYVDKAIV